MRKALFLILVALACTSVSAQTIRTDFDLKSFGVHIKPDKRLLIVRTTLLLAGIDSDLSPEGRRFRNKVLAEFNNVDPILKNKFAVFVAQYKKRNPDLSDAEIVSPFISMAYSLTPAPGLAEPPRTTDLPGNLLEVLDYSPLVREFYNTAGTAAKFDKLFEEYKGVAEKTTSSARDMVRDVLDYLHTRPSLSYIDRVKVEVEVDGKKVSRFEPVERFRKFTIVPDFLAAKNNINFLNIGDNYYAVMSPKTDVSSSELRRGYLQFVIDPMILKEGREIQIKGREILGLVRAQKKSPRRFTNDPILVVSRSMVAAADIREEYFRKVRLATSQARRSIDLTEDVEKKKQISEQLNDLRQELSDEATLQLSEAYERGAIFAFYFAEKLIGTEQSGFDVAGSMTDWILNLKPEEEKNRIEQTAPIAQRAIIARERRKTRAAAPLTENPLTKALLQVDEKVNTGSFEDAKTDLNGLLEKYKTNVVETARIYYSLGRVNSLKAEKTKDPEKVTELLLEAKEHYTKVLVRASKQDLALISSAYFALGRIYEHFNQNDYAVRIYEAALKIGNVNGGAFEEAFEAKKKLLEKAKGTASN